MLNIDKLIEDLHLEEDEEMLDSLESTPQNINEFTSDKLCAIIAVNNYLNSYPADAINAMEILSKRRLDGDQFNFEDKIQEMSSSFIKLDVKSNSFIDLFSIIKNKGQST